MTEDPFNQRWHHLIAHARQVPEPPLPLLDPARVIAARGRLRPRLRIGWLPPSLAAAAMLAGIISWSAGLDPRPFATESQLFLADLPQHVPHAPEISTPALPSAASVIAGIMPLADSFTIHGFLETTP